VRLDGGIASMDWRLLAGRARFAKNCMFRGWLLPAGSLNSNSRPARLLLQAVILSP